VKRKMRKNIVLYHVERGEAKEIKEKVNAST